MPDGETRLVFAVLEDAVRCYVKTVNSSRRCDREQFDEVQRWFHAEAGIHSPFSFEYVCDVLGIDPTSFRGTARIAERQGSADQADALGGPKASRTRRALIAQTINGGTPASSPESRNREARRVKN